MDRRERNSGVFFEGQELLTVERDARDVDFPELVFGCHDFYRLPRSGERLFREQLEQDLSMGFFVGGAIALDLRLLSLALRCLAELVLFGEEQRLLVAPRFEVEEGHGEGSGQDLFSRTLALVLHADGETRRLLSAGELRASSRERLFREEARLRPALFFCALSFVPWGRRRQASVGLHPSRLQTERQREVRAGRKMSSFRLKQQSATASRLRSRHRKLERIGLTESHPRLSETPEFLCFVEGSPPELEEIVREREVKPSVPRRHGRGDLLEPKRLLLQTQLTFRYLFLERPLPRERQGLGDADDELGRDAVIEETRAELCGEARRLQQRRRSCLFSAEERGAGRERDKDLGASLHRFLERVAQAEHLGAGTSLGMPCVLSLEPLERTASELGGSGCGGRRGAPFGVSSRRHQSGLGARGNRDRKDRIREKERGSESPRTKRARHQAQSLAGRSPPGGPTNVGCPLRPGVLESEVIR